MNKDGRLAKMIVGSSMWITHHYASKGAFWLFYKGFGEYLSLM